MDCAISHHVNSHCGLSHLHDAEHGRPIYGPAKIVVVVQVGQLDRSPARFLAAGRRRSARGLCLSRTWLSEIPGRPEAVAQPAKMVDVDHPVLDPQGRGVVRNRRTPTPVHGEAARRAPYGHLLSEIAVGLSARFSAPGGRDRSETHTLHPGHMGREAARRRGPMSPGGLAQESPCRGTR